MVRSWVVVTIPSPAPSTPYWELSQSSQNKSEKWGTKKQGEYERKSQKPRNLMTTIRVSAKTYNHRIKGRIRSEGRGIARVNLDPVLLKKTTKACLCVHDRKKRRRLEK